MIDSSIVRGTTSRRIVKLLKEAGLQKSMWQHCQLWLIHVSGIDIQSREELIAANHTVGNLWDYRCRIAWPTCPLMTIDSNGIDTVHANGEYICVAYFDEIPNAFSLDYEERYLRAWMSRHPLLGLLASESDQSSVGSRKKRNKQMTNRMHTRSGVDVEAGYEVILNGSKKTLLIRKRGCYGALGGFRHVWPFKNRCQRACFDQVQMVLVLADACHQYNKHDTIGQDCVAMCVPMISSLQVRSPSTSWTMSQLVKMNQKLS